MCCIATYRVIDSTNETMVTIKNAPSPNLQRTEQRRHIHFQEFVTIIPSPSPLDHHDAENNHCNLWYKIGELETFRNEARDTCREMRYHDNLLCFAENNTSDSESSTSSSQDNISSRKLPSLARNSLTRGLEQRSCEERQRRKCLSIRFIVKVAPQLYKDSPERLSQLAQKCNSWATDLAIEEAARDYIRVYANDETKQIIKAMNKRTILASASTDDSRITDEFVNNNTPVKRARQTK